MCIQNNVGEIKEIVNEQVDGYDSFSTRDQWCSESSDRVTLLFAKLLSWFQVSKGKRWQRERPKLLCRQI